LLMSTQLLQYHIAKLCRISFTKFEDVRKTMVECHRKLTEHKL